MTQNKYQYINSCYLLDEFLVKAGSVICCSLLICSRKVRLWLVYDSGHSAPILVQNRGRWGTPSVSELGCQYYKEQLTIYEHPCTILRSAYPNTVQRGPSLSCSNSWMRGFGWRLRSYESSSLVPGSWWLFQPAKLASAKPGFCHCGRASHFSRFWSVCRT